MVLRIQGIAAANLARPRIHRVTNNGDAFAKAARNLENAGQLRMTPSAIRLDLAAPIRIDLSTQAGHIRVTRPTIPSNLAVVIRIHILLKDFP